LLSIVNMACVLFGLTPEEALMGVTANAAQALGLKDRGVIAAGMQADLALWDVERPGELAYRLGGNPLAGLIRRGEWLRGLRTSSASSDRSRP
jgi:imidazolonepropionase